MSTSSPVAAGGRKADEVLARLNRAVQRATIYPEGHPAIRSAVGPFLASLRAILDERPSLVIVISRDRLAVEGEPPTDRPSALSWLAQQLHGRGLAALTLQGVLSEDEAIRFILWLGRPEATTVLPADDPRFDGISYARLDYSLARFREGAALDAGAEAEATRSWVSVVGSLTEGWFTEETGPFSDDPETLGRELGAHIARNEGVGSAVLMSRVIALGGRLAVLPKSVRNAVKKRLGSFIAALTPDLQSELLRMAPDADPARMAFVSEMIDALPDTLVMDVLASIEASGAHIPHQFITFMQKLVGLAARDPVLAEATENRLESLGLPRNLTTQSPSDVRAALEEVLKTRTDDTAHNPKAYQARLEELSARRIRRAADFTEGRHGDPRSAQEVGLHVSEIAQRLLLSAPASPEAPTYLKRLLDDLPGALEASRFDFAYSTAAALRDLTTSRVSEEVASLATEYASALGRKESVDALLTAVERSSAPPTPATVGLFRLGGLEAACAAFERISASGDEASRERLTDLVVFLEADDFNAAIAQVRSKGSASPAALFSVLRHPGAPRGVEIAQTFLGNKDPEVRLGALRILFEAGAKEGSFERCLEKALSDADPRVVVFGLDQARRRKGPETARLVGEYLEGGLGGASPRELQMRAVEELAEAGIREARDALVAALAERGLALGAGTRAVSREIALTLERIGDDISVAAVRRWRRSPAGLLGRLLDGKEAP
ncbi:MAG: hypothetical protein ACHQNV_00175 [Vicinamibacteria bacterium]